MIIKKCMLYPKSCLKKEEEEEEEEI